MKRRYTDVGIHPCSIILPDCWPRLTPRANILRRILRSIRESALPSYYHPDTKYIFKSMYTFRSEKSRMIYHCNPLVIHPFSCLMVLMEITSFVTCFAYFFIEIFRIYFFLHREISAPYILLKILQITFVCTKFLVGYMEIKHEQKLIILDLKKIAINYLKTYLFIDLLDVSRIFLLLIENETVVLWLNILIFHVYIGLKFLNKTTNNLRLILRIVFRMQQRYHSFVSFVVIVILCVHYNTCLLYGMPRMLDTLMGDYDPSYIERIQDPTSEKIYNYVIRFHRILLFFYRSQAPYSSKQQVHQVKVECFINIIMFFLHIYILVFVLLTMKNMNHASIKYGFMWTNVLNFLHSRNISGKLRYKILAHYQYKFQYKYFDEAFIIESLSKHLQFENMLHTCSHLIVNVSLLRGLPKMVIGRIIAELHPVVYLPNDIIMKVATNFECLYFISYGTVALYNSSGKEVMHLEDGGILGAIGYYAGINYLTVTSVTITELYKWNIRDVNNVSLSCPELSHRIKMLGRCRIVKALNKEEKNEPELNPVFRKLGRQGKRLRTGEPSEDLIDSSFRM